MQVKVMIMQAEKPTKNDKVYSAETLRKVAEMNSGLFSYQSRVLYAHVELEDKPQLTRVTKQAFSMAAQVQGDK